MPKKVRRWRVQNPVELVMGGQVPKASFFNSPDPAYNHAKEMRTAVPTAMYSWPASYVTTVRGSRRARPHLRRIRG